MAIDTTVGSASANSYATVSEYKTYWGSRLFNTAQLAASDGVIEAALEWACRLLDATFRWKGGAVDDVQSLNWPRNGVLSPNGFAIDPTTIPRQLKDAQSEYAGVLLSGDRTADDPSLKIMGSETILSSVKAGPVALTFGGGNFSTLESFDAFVRSLGTDFAYLQKSMPDSVRLLIPPGWYTQASLKRKIIFGAL